MSDDDNRTRIITPAAAPKADESEVATRMFTGNAESSSAPSGNAPVGSERTRVITGVADTPKSPDTLYDLAVGWVVIIEGPGRGCTKEIFYGMNSIGRDNNERIPLDFGDDNISRSAHAFLVFDEKQNEFFLQHGGKTNLVRLNDAPVLAPMQLHHGDIIEMGATKLMFIPLCSENFKWEDNQS